MKVVLYGGGFKVFEVLTFLIGRNSGERLRGVQIHMELNLLIFILLE